MTVEELKVWERMTPYMRTVKPREFSDWCGDSQKCLAALRNLAPELIALWETANDRFRDDNYTASFLNGSDSVHRALNALNAKAKEIQL